MATQRVTFICDICGEEHGIEDNAIKCEKTHYKPISITAYEYGKEKKEFPETINIKLSNSEGKEKVITFYRKQNSH